MFCSGTKGITPGCTPRSSFLRHPSPLPCTLAAALLTRMPITVPGSARVGFWGAEAGQRLPPLTVRHSARQRTAPRWIQTLWAEGAAGHSHTPGKRWTKFSLCPAVLALACCHLTVRSALPMAMEVYFKGRKERDADYFRMMLFLTN